MMPRRFSVMLISVLAHATLIVAIILVSILAPDILPVPRNLLAWGADRVVHLEDIPLPSPPMKRAAPLQPIAPDVVGAPRVAPDSIRPETGLEGATSTLASTIDGVERATGLVEGFGIVETAPPPPPPPAHADPVHLHSGIETPRKIVNVAPVYPDLARVSHVQGIVILEATIDATGNVTSARVLRSVPLLDEAAVTAVLRWKFTPARLNGEAIPVVMTVTVNFTLNQ